MPEEVKLARAAQNKIWRSTNPERAKSYKASKVGDPDHNLHVRTLRFGLTLQEYLQILAAQDDVCPICLRQLDGQATAIDHDARCCPGRRSCGSCVRGVLHRNCNVGLGMLGDDPETLSRAASYVKTRGVAQ